MSCECKYTENSHGWSIYKKCKDCKDKFQRERKYKIPCRISAPRMCASRVEDQANLDCILANLEENVNAMNCLEIGITFKPVWDSYGHDFIRKMVKGTFERILKSRARALKMLHQTDTMKLPYVKLVYEISPGGHFHYHGFISGFTRDEIEELRKVMKVYVGRTELKTVQYMDSYIEYMLKRYTKERSQYKQIMEHWDIQVKLKIN